MFGENGRDYSKVSAFWPFLVAMAILAIVAAYTYYMDSEPEIPARQTSQPASEPGGMAH